MAAFNCAADTVCGAAGSCARTADAATLSAAAAHSTRADRRMPAVIWWRRSFGHRSLVQLERELEVARLVARDLHGVLPRVAGCAVRTALAPHRAQQPLEAQVPDAVGFEELADLLERVRRGNQLGLLRCVDTVEAGRDRRRTADAHVDFLRAGRAHH